MVKIYTEKKTLDITLYDFGDDGTAVWRVTVGDDIRYVEGFITDEVWAIVDAAVHAHDEPRILAIGSPSEPAVPFLGIWLDDQA